MNNSKSKIRIHTDGGARGNPGPAGAGWIIEIPDKGARQNSKALGTQTNNYAEYEAIVLALSDLKKLIPKNKRRDIAIEIVLDSELAARQLSGEYQIKDEPLQLQYMRIHNIRVSDFPHITFTHVSREQNKEADRLVNEAIDAHSGGLFDS